MENHIWEIIATYGVYAIFVLCTIEGDITLLISGVMAHNQFFGNYSFLKVLLFGTAGGVAGDSFGYWLGRFFADKIQNYGFYRRSQPRIDRLIEKFGGAAIIISKYIYGIRVAICISSGVAKMPFGRFLLNDALSCGLWALILASVGYFFSGAITSIIGDFHQVGIALFILVVLGVVGFFLLETMWLSKKVEEADPETIHKIEDKIHDLEERLHIPHAHRSDEEIPVKEKEKVEIEK